MQINGTYADLRPNNGPISGSKTITTGFQGAHQILRLTEVHRDTKSIKCKI